MFTVRILGSSSATPAFSRFPSAQVVNYNDRYYLVDCGEGVQMQLQRYKVKYSRIDAVFISHLHGDHILGAPGLLASLSIFERTAPLPVFAPAGLKDMLEVVFRHSETYLRFELVFHALEDFAPGDVIFETDRLQVRTFPLHHRTFCRGFLFAEKNKRRKFNFFKAKELNIPKGHFQLLKQEKDVTLPDGRVILAEDVLFPREAAISYAYCSDTMPSPEIVEHVRDITWLYHEATFMEGMRARAEQTYHSTTLDAAQTALAANVKHLIIGHFSARYHDLEPLLEEARTVFPVTDLAIEGRTFDLRADV